MKVVFDADMYEDEDCSEGVAIDNRDNCILFCAVAPHEGTDFKWMVRAALQSNFDRWSNSTGWEDFFETDDAAVNYIQHHAVEIYKCLLRNLTV